MSIVFRCDCGRQLQVKDEFAGKKGKCPSCGAEVDIPDQETAAEREAAERRERETAATDFEAEFSDHSDLDPEERQRLAEEREQTQQEEVEVLTHKGRPIPAQMDFFIDPPEEIGQLMTVYSTLKKDVEPMLPGARVGLAGGIAIGGLLGGVILGSLIDSTELGIIIGLVLATLAFAITLWTTGFKHTCTYVGFDGIAKYQCKGSREQITEEIFLFEDASELRTSQTRRYVNGGYQGTDYSFSWTDLGGRVCYTLKGTYQSEEGDPPAKDLFNFALSAERAWTGHLLNQVQGQVSTQGTVYFGLTGKNWVRLGEETIIIHWKGETTELQGEEIGEVRIQDGWFEVRHIDAKEGWFSSSGIYKFPYGDLGNAQLFMILLHELVGIRFD